MRCSPRRAQSDPYARARYQSRAPSFLEKCCRIHAPRVLLRRVGATGNLSIDLLERVPHANKSAVWRPIATLSITTLCIALFGLARYAVDVWSMEGCMVGLRSVVTALTLIAVSTTGCSTQQIARFETNVAANRCADAGLIAGSGEHQRCVAAHLAAADQERATSQAVMLTVVGAAAQANAAEQEGRAAATSNSPYGNTAYRLTRSWWSAGRRMCEYADRSILNVGTGDCPSAVTAP